MLDFKGYDVLPYHTQSELRRYVEEGYMPGSFLTAVLCNDLFKAVAHADSSNIATLDDLVKFIYNRVDSRAWGSAQRMREWTETVWAAKKLVDGELV